ncbi:hypothetical protein LXL04_005670 [Taraxacum kok-saghyz]
MFSMTSFGAKIDETVNAVVRTPLKYLARFAIDNEVANRMRFYGGSRSSDLSPETVCLISLMLHRNNRYVRLFKTAKEIAAEQRLPEFSVRLYYYPKRPETELPHTGVLGAIVSGDDENSNAYDVIVNSREGHPQRVNRLHSSYMSLQYPLLFPYGEEGWALHMRQTHDGVPTTKALTANMYYSYVIHFRENGTYRSSNSTQSASFPFQAGLSSTATDNGKQTGKN